jgi:hypothetical protein
MTMLSEGMTIPKWANAGQEITTRTKKIEIRTVFSMKPPPKIKTTIPRIFLIPLHRGLRFKEKSSTPGLQPRVGLLLAAPVAVVKKACADASSSQKGFIMG